VAISSAQIEQRSRVTDSTAQLQPAATAQTTGACQLREIRNASAKAQRSVRSRLKLGTAVFEGKYGIFECAMCTKGERISGVLGTDETLLARMCR